MQAWLRETVPQQRQCTCAGGTPAHTARLVKSCASCMAPVLAPSSRAATHGAVCASSCGAGPRPPPGGCAPPCGSARAAGAAAAGAGTRAAAPAAAARSAAAGAAPAPAAGAAAATAALAAAAASRAPPAAAPAGAAAAAGPAATGRACCPARCCWRAAAGCCGRGWPSSRRSPAAAAAAAPLGTPATTRCLLRLTRRPSAPATSGPSEGPRPLGCRLRGKERGSASCFLAASAAATMVAASASFPTGTDQERVAAALAPAGLAALASRPCSSRALRAALHKARQARSTQLLVCSNTWATPFPKANASKASGQAT